MTYNKPIAPENNVFAKTTTRTMQLVNSSYLSFTKCYRNPVDATTDGWKSNYFKSFNLPYQYNRLPSGTTTNPDGRPEIYQLNVEEIVICPIPESYYSEIIDGRTIEMKIPQFDAVAGVSAKTVVSSTYATLQLSQSDVLLGDNIAFLFSDDVNLPYKGTIYGASTSLASRSTWKAAVRPFAVPYSLLQGSDFSSDGRAWSSVNTAVSVPNGYPSINNANTGYTYDIPVGFAVLDKGYMVLTHPSIINNIPWSAGTRMHFDSTGLPVIDGDNMSNSVDNICFTGTTGTTNSYARFIDVSTNFKMNVICLALPGEFYMSDNDTWDYAANQAVLDSSSSDFDSIYITEVGLYNDSGELIAVAKLDRPVEKEYTSILNFNLEINM